MTHPTDPIVELAQEIDAEGARIAKAALGLPEEARLMSLNLDDAALFVHYGRDGMVTARSSLSKTNAAAVMRQIADAWEQEG
ncbi:hypothetical protein [Microbacterium allomyrinae]|uniref:Uncharacterized protein n=1 Tax=Microbacterium allomyrinae TaxID=2830666 RepID=A0A9X1LYI1_9MICO|nr:hypothetical protein [Microbacterium allomyrinae]MCC2034217.1 hypothetical protein [Microbacterium allomyrinae]